VDRSMAARQHHKFERRALGPRPNRHFAWSASYTASTLSVSEYH
jgi:hypothetical protein